MKYQCLLYKIYKYISINNGGPKYFRQLVWIQVLWMKEKKKKTFCIPTITSDTFHWIPKISFRSAIFSNGRRLKISWKREVKQRSHVTKDFLYRREVDPKSDENNEKYHIPLLKPLF